MEQNQAIRDLENAELRAFSKPHCGPEDIDPDVLRDTKYKKVKKIKHELENQIF